MPSIYLLNLASTLLFNLVNVIVLALQVSMHNPLKVTPPKVDHL